jgi:hypothetical protein
MVLGCEVGPLSCVDRLVNCGRGTGIGAVVLGPTSACAVTGTGDGVCTNCEEPREKDRRMWFASAPRRNASYAGLASRGIICLGIAVVNDLTEDEGGLQLSRGMTAVSLGSPEDSTTRPK